MAVWTAPDWSLPLESTNYLDVLDYIDFRLDDCITSLSGTLSKSYINLPVDAQRWNSTGTKWEKWTGSAWVDLSNIYAINISGTSSNVTGTVLAVKGGTGFSSYTIGDLLVANSSTSLSKIAAVAAGKVLLSSGVATLPVWGSIDLQTHVTGTLPVTRGGSGVANITGLVYGNGTSSFSSAANYISINTTTSLVSFSGSIVSSGSITSSSDIRLKSNISTIDNALDKTKKLRGVYYDMNGLPDIGVIAQEVEEVLPEVVKNTSEYKSVAYGNITALLIEAIKELSAKVERLENAG